MTRLLKVLKHAGIGAAIGLLIILLLTNSIAAAFWLGELTAGVIPVDEGIARVAWICVIGGTITGAFLGSMWDAR